MKAGRIGQEREQQRAVGWCAKESIRVTVGLEHVKQECMSIIPVKQFRVYLRDGRAPTTVRTDSTCGTADFPCLSSTASH
jgi:hypothetical protein